MNVLEVRKRFEFDASPQRLWRALTDADELARWFPDRRADFRPEAGYQGEFVWHPSESTAKCGGTSFAVRVEEAEAPRRLVWSWAREGDTPFEKAYTTRVEWTLTERSNGGTILELVESGFEKEADRAGNDSGWDHELGELTTLLEAGVGAAA